ncbi:MAG: hypothetical protein ACRELY_16775, partial [Polyangiaceae bacterium]
ESIARAIDTARYAIVYARSALEAAGGEAGLRSQIERFSAEKEHVLIRKIDGVGKKVDVRAFVRRLALDDAGGKDAVVRAGLAGDLLVVTADVAVTGSGSAKVSEVAQAILADVPHRAIRVALGACRGDHVTSPLDLSQTLHAQ